MSTGAVGISLLMIVGLCVIALATAGVVVAIRLAGRSDRDRMLAALVEENRRLREELDRLKEGESP